MADSYALALQKALVAALKSDAGVAALVGARVYDRPPQKPTRPYLQIGGILPRPLRTSEKSAARVTFSIEAHSRNVAGRVEATQCTEAVVSALDETTELNVTGFSVVFVRWLTQEIEPDQDGISHTGIAVFETVLDG